jgi:sigma-B regulation protein RsbU (phosphoserine phosphatase)
MTNLIDSVLDLAQARLGGGLKLDTNGREPLGPVLNQVIDELRSSWPGRQIDVDIDLPKPLACDAQRIAQLLSNLLANALTHGADAPVTVRAQVRAGNFELSVTNQGEPLPASGMKRLFEPFYRPSGKTGAQGLGLGLFIASEIARAHGGTLSVTSEPKATTFVFSMPAV